ncbi:universal stress protein [Mycobacteroides salmoniphilum]|uniref:universal stress protein n=1 Tax=Mycobacteroides salmoniphilum TaxID=404941 RepID=UPI001065443D|nr:universal stress protein [Mycobacteroides salmoniphilum]TDZ90730.1 Universal stress protein [Mycobacteroides salmoniphilum]
MTDTDRHGPVVVGIDGSRAAVHAAEWAVDEAISRDVPLCLVHVTRPVVTAKSFVDQYNIDKEYAETSLRDAAAAVKETGKPVKVDCVIRHGLASDALAAESQTASLVCVGSEGFGRLASAFWGSTATEIAKRAHCPVAIVHRPVFVAHGLPVWIAVAVNGPQDTDTVIDHAVQEARLRHLPILAVGTWQEDMGASPYDELDRRVASLRERYPDVHTYPVAARSDIGHFLTNCDEPIQLAVVGRADIPHVIRMRPSAEHGDRTILIVRN